MLFLGKVTKRLFKILGIDSDSIHTSSYRPQSNGMEERLHGIQNQCAMAVDNGVDWFVFLLMTLFAIRLVTNRHTGLSPHELVFGRKVRGPLGKVLCRLGGGLL